MQRLVWAEFSCFAFDGFILGNWHYLLSRFFTVLLTGWDRTLGVAGILTIYSVTSLINHNRRQKILWIDRELQRLLDAKKAYVAGTATAEQIELLEKEKAADEEKRRRDELKKETAFYKAKEWVFGGLKRDDAAEGALTETQREPSRILEAVNAKAAEAELASAHSASRAAGLGDRAADDAQTNAGESKKSWTSWVTGR